MSRTIRLIVSEAVSLFSVTVVSLFDDSEVVPIVVVVTVSLLGSSIDSRNEMLITKVIQNMCNKISR